MSSLTNQRVSINSPKMSSNSNIPLRRPLSRQNSTQSKIPVNNPEAHKWRHKYDESELKRKALLSEKEKALRIVNDLDKKYVDLQVKHEHMETELFEKNEEYTKLSTASKNLYREYELLKNQYETETNAMSSALKDASHWYKENKELKRRTVMLDKDTVDEGGDDASSNESDIENLNKIIKQLSQEIAELQTEVDTLKQAEFQTLEQNAKLNEEVETERDNNDKLQHELVELRREHEQILRVSAMMQKELQGLKESEENQRASCANLKKEANNYKKERNVLAHQSTLIMQNFQEDSNGNDLMLLQEIEDLKRTLEDERNRHEEELNSLQEQLEDQENQNNPQIEVLEEQLKLIEAELQTAVERAEKAEIALKASMLPPPPPPPPPPLPGLLPQSRPIVPLRVKRKSRVNVLDLAETIGVNDIPDKKAAPGVNDDIINAIKQGKFTLKKRMNDDDKKDKAPPKAVTDILNVLGSLRRAPKKRASQYIAVPDKQ